MADPLSTTPTDRLAALEQTVYQLRRQVRQLAALCEPVHHRPGTMDAGIWLSVVQNNEYRLPPVLAPTDSVVDIGAHIGGFSFACLSRGAGRVLAFECWPPNFALAATNLSRFGARCVLAPAAVWRSDGHPGPVAFAPDPDPTRTGSGGVAPTGPISCPTTPFDTVIDEAARRTGRVRLVKLDCEASEYPILLTSRRLDLIDAVCGEYHEFGVPPPHARVPGVDRYDRETVRRHLERAGFDVELVAHASDPQLGLFFARRAGRS